MQLIENWEKFVFNSWSAIVPILLFFLILGLAILSGIRRGLIGGIIVLAFGISGWLVGFFVSPILTKAILNAVKFRYLDGQKYDLSKFWPAIFSISMFIIQIVFNIGGEIITKVFKGVIMKPIKDRENNHISTIPYRSLGAVVSTVGVIPCAVLTTNIIGIISSNNGAINTNDKLLSGITFGKGTGISKYTPGLIGAAKLDKDWNINEDKQLEEKQSIISSFNWYLKQFIDADNYAIIFDSANNSGQKEIEVSQATLNKMDAKDRAKILNALITTIQKNAKGEVDSKIRVYFNFNTKKDSDGLKYDPKNNYAEYISDQNSYGMDKIKNVVGLFNYSYESFTIFEEIITKLPVDSKNNIFKEFYSLVDNAGLKWNILFGLANFKFNINQEYQIELKNKVYIQKIKDVIFSLFQKADERFTYQKDLLNDENIMNKKEKELNTTNEKIYWIISTIINNVFVVNK
ncbi:hypothetical protein [Mycoplasmopsis primatum]|uniref:hypothetical protein n=1 Tax=Mycoplasmopsis primatum TaxID=55604 RepID=UPI0004984B49|nr:hypothetical protein [Mycoplasmopsis primatum]